MPTLAAVLAESPFPLFGLPPGSWPGACFVGTVVRHGTPHRVTLAQLVYTDERPPQTTAIAISHLDPRGGFDDPLGAHLGSFAARFDPRFVPRRLGRAVNLFPREDFTVRSMVASVAGLQLGAELLAHRDAPLSLLRAAAVRGDAAVDLGVAAWGADPKRASAELVPVDLAFAQSFDRAAAAPPYPPAAWIAEGGPDA